MTGWGAVEVPRENHRSSGDGRFESTLDEEHRCLVFALLVGVVVQMGVEEGYWVWGGSEEEPGGCANSVAACSWVFGWFGGRRPGYSAWRGYFVITRGCEGYEGGLTKAKMDPNQLD